MCSACKYNFPVDEAIANNAILHGIDFKFELTIVECWICGAFYIEPHVIADLNQLIVDSILLTGKMTQEVHWMLTKLTLLN